MKKLVLLFALTIPFLTFAQIDSTFTEVLIKEVAGIKITGHYKIINEQESKKEYIIKVFYENTNSKDIVYESSTTKFAQIRLKDLPSYIFILKGNKTGKKQITIPKNKITEANVFYEKWYKNGEVPEFVLIEAKK